MAGKEFARAAIVSSLLPITPSSSSSASIELAAAGEPKAAKKLMPHSRLRFANPVIGFVIQDIFSTHFKATMSCMRKMPRTAKGRTLTR
ncbi:hypothetical protein AKJ64_03540 [candidate division MSBL1 archaeon SCGC-AAA259E17]|uniref:Uncharacterized protein n=1 Tax=candidate division MSBL1 archaeon SCGC-AAA259E17 TaxID=1698263 RepID=A0A133UDK2_9EURY|nr:hypothetical protein AKJ64_03540 [candidate division MSBL1 archaeon SCGC-AAA259E17]